MQWPHQDSTRGLIINTNNKAQFTYYLDDMPFLKHLGRHFDARVELAEWTNTDNLSISFFQAGNCVLRIDLKPGN